MSSKRARKFRNAVSQIVETLEKRLMMSTVALTAASGNANLTIAYNPATQQYNFSGGLNTPAPVAAASITGFTVTGGGASASLTILGGSPTLLNDAGSDGTSLSVTVDSGASLSFSTTEHLASLTVDASGTARMLGTHQVLDTSGLTLSGSAGAWTGTLDLGSSDMIVHNGNLTTLTSQIASGYNNGLWNGSGIESSGAASDPTHLTALGILANNNGGTALYSTFDGQTAVSTDILIKNTLYGDANLDGHVDGSDYSLIDNGYLTHATGWSNGDFNYDGVIDGSDYTLIDNAFNTQPGTPTPAIRLSGASTVEPGSTYTLDYTVVGDQIPSAISINWGDGNTSTVAGSSTSDTHTYSLTGSYAVAVTATIGGTTYTSSSFGLDSSFGQTGISATTAPLTAADAIVLKPDGTTVVLDSADGLLESFNSDGSVNTSFGSEGITHLTLSTVAKALAVDQLGNVYVTGIDSSNNLAVEQITPGGVLNTATYGTGGNALVLSSAPSNILAGGASLIAVPTGSTTSEEILSVDNNGAFEVARLLSDGTPDPAAGSGGIFNGPNVSLVAGANVQSAIALDGNLLLAGRTATGTVLEQFNKSGGLDTAFNGGAAVTLTNSVTSLAVSGSGNIFVGTVSASNQAYINALQANGSAGSTFGAAGVVQLPVGIVSGGITSVAVQGDNNLLAVGAATGGGVLAAEFEDDGSLDNTFGVGGLFAVPLSATGFVSEASAVVQPDGQAVIAATINAGTSSAGNVLRLNETNQIIVQQSLTLVPYKQASPIFAGTAEILTAQGDALPGSGNALNWSEYLGGNLVESVSAPVDEDGYSFAFSTLNPGQYTVDVVGLDGASASYSFTVLANSPTVSISGPTSATPSSVVVLIADAAHDPAPPSPDDLDPSVQTGPGDTIDSTLSYSWSVSYQASSGPVVPFNLPTGTPTTLSSLYFETGDAGSYITTLQVVSSDGGSPTTVTHKINVGGVAPTVSLTPVTTALAYNLSEAHSVVVQPDGKIVVAGLTDDSSGYPTEIAVVRYNKDLSLDTTFGDGTGIVYLSLGSNIEDLDILGDGGYDSVPIALQPDGKILVGTYQATDPANIQAGGDGYSEIFRLNTDGSPDFSFNLSGMVLTQFTQQTLDPINGSPDSVIDTTGVVGLKVLDSGEIVATQELTNGDNSTYWAVTRFSGSG
jgi:uncharacterized delta-60 repeat protein